MPPEVAILPRCVECNEVWLPADPARWRLRLDVDGDLLWFCPDRNWREFGEGKDAD